MGERIARCRLIFSVLLTAAVLLDPRQPALNPWTTLLGGSYPTEPDFLGTVLLHLTYSVAAYAAVVFELAPPTRLALLTTVSDVLFAGAIAYVTEGRSALFYPFFTFAIVRTGLQRDLRSTMIVAAASAGLWLALIAMLAPANLQLYIMRPVYLGIVGYLVGFLGEQRTRLEAEVRTLEATEQRLRIARELHDGCVQTLGAVNLQLAGWRRLLKAGRAEEILAQLDEVQRSVNREHDELRAYLRSLAGLPATTVVRADGTEPRLAVHIDLDAPAPLVEQVFGIVREGVTNVRRHARATSAVIHASAHGSAVEISIADDGEGFPDDAERPWSIVSRVSELGGSLAVAHDRTSGAQLTISLPAA
jgi:signal transduction histidine kinase